MKDKEGNFLNFSKLTLTFVYKCSTSETLYGLPNTYGRFWDTLYVPSYLFQKVRFVVQHEKVHDLQGPGGEPVAETPQRSIEEERLF